MKRECKVDPEVDNQTIIELLGDDEEDEDDVEEKTKPVAGDHKPISLHESMYFPQFYGAHHFCFIQFLFCFNKSFRFEIKNSNKKRIRKFCQNKNRE